MYNLLRHSRELGTGPRKHGLGSRALQQGPLNCKESNSFCLLIDHLDHFWLRLPTCNYQLIQARKKKIKSFRPKPSSFLVWVTHGLAVAFLPRHEPNSEMQVKALVVLQGQERGWYKGVWGQVWS